MTFEPHFMMRRCGGPPDSQACQDNCINKGRYCAMDTIDEEWAVHYKGWQVGLVLRGAVQTTCQVVSLWLQQCGLRHKGWHPSRWAWGLVFAAVD